MVDVVDVGGVGRQGAADHLLELGPVEPRPEPVGRHLARLDGVVLAAVLHREGLGEGAAEARHQPVLVGRHLADVVVLDRDEVLEDGGDEVERQTVQVALRRVLDPVAAPVVVDPRLEDLVLAPDALGQQALQPLVAGERDVRPVVEDEAARVAKRGGVAARVRVLVVDDRRPARLGQPPGGAQSGHAATQHRDPAHRRIVPDPGPVPLPGGATTIEPCASSCAFARA